MVALGLAALASANPAIEGHWRLDPAASSALDGWHKIDLNIGLDGSKVAVAYTMQWRTTIHEATNVFDTNAPTEQQDFFRVEQRHMAVYPAKHGVTKSTAAWIDGGKTLRTEALTPVEVSQGDVIMRITTEYRVSELGDKLTVIELHSTRNRPLVYVFNKVTGEDAK
ncbi:MAG: hypothetical protein IT582_02450 [Opitutaceae bacterium]|nr:hypothetical protein [Opitutaceae bacterium]